MLIKKKINKEKLPSAKNSKHFILFVDSLCQTSSSLITVVTIALIIKQINLIALRLLISFCLAFDLDTVSENIAELVYKLHLSKEYMSAKSSDAKGSLKTKIGTVSAN
jgi:hypothetical protein